MSAAKPAYMLVMAANSSLCGFLMCKLYYCKDSFKSVEFYVKE